MIIKTLVFGVVRQARQRCESGVYHVTLRGINRGDILFDDDDRLHFWETFADDPTVTSTPKAKKPKKTY